MGRHPRLAAALRHAPPLVVALAAEHVVTLAGAMALRAAELAGLARPAVLRACERRIAVLEGGERGAGARLVVAAEAVETERLAREARVVPAVARMDRRHW